MLKKNNKTCGVDSYNNYLYVGENESCPLNFITIKHIFNNNEQKSID
jgi:hypothetical protein